MKTSAECSWTMDLLEKYSLLTTLKWFRKWFPALILILQCNLTQRKCWFKNSDRIWLVGCHGCDKETRRSSLAIVFATINVIMYLTFHIFYWISFYIDGKWWRYLAIVSLSEVSILLDLIYNNRPWAFFLFFNSISMMLVI